MYHSSMPQKKQKLNKTLGAGRTGLFDKKEYKTQMQSHNIFAKISKNSQ